MTKEKLQQHCQRAMPSACRWKVLLPLAMVFFAVGECLAQVSGGARCQAVHLAQQPANSPAPVQPEAVTWRSSIQIPVVVHVLWNDLEENISDAQILSQLDVLNWDFQAENVEVASIPSVFQALVADVGLEFCLAQIDPDGNPTTGITRKFTNNSVGIGGSTSIHYSAQGGQDAWDPERYLNIWVAKFAGGIGGTASFPGEGPAAEQGVEIDYQQFGTLNVMPPYHLGRTCTHEIGHYFNLEHPWGPNFNDCCADDFVADTPAACETYLGECPAHPVSSCSGPDMFMNFMFYTDDACMGMFTIGQKARMLATLTSVRAGLLAGGLCSPVATLEPRLGFSLQISPNPTRGNLRFTVESNEPGTWRYRLLDPLGRSMAAGEVMPTAPQLLDLQHFPAGIYFLEIEKEGKRQVERVLVL